MPCLAAEPTPHHTRRVPRYALASGGRRLAMQLAADAPNAPLPARPPPRRRSPPSQHRRRNDAVYHGNGRCHTLFLSHLSCLRACRSKSWSQLRDNRSIQALETSTRNHARPCRLRRSRRDALRRGFPSLLQLPTRSHSHGRGYDIGPERHQAPSGSKNEYHGPLQEPTRSTWSVSSG